MRGWVGISTLLAAIAILQGPVHPSQFTVTRVIDGNTVRARGHDIEVVIRLVGISAPTVSHRTGEPSQFYAHEALGYLTARALDKTIDLKRYGVDPRHRILGIMTLDGTDLNLEMVRAGFARVDQQDDLDGLDLTPFRQAE